MALHSLTDIAAVAVVAPLWYEYGLPKITKREDPPDRHKMHENHKRETAIIDKIKIFSLPSLLTQTLVNIVQPMGQQIQIWVDSHPFLEKTNISPYLDKVLCWTAPGVIDLTPSAVKVIDFLDDNVNSFRMACLYCFESKIYEYWPKVSSHFERFKTNLTLDEPCLILYWISYLQDNIKLLMEITGSLYRCSKRYGLSLALITTCDAGVDYFLMQFSEAERYEVAKYELHHTSYRSYDPMILSLFKYLRKADINQYHQEREGMVLSAYLDWPCQEQFLEKATEITKFLTRNGFYCIVEEFSHYFHTFSKCQIYKNLLQKFWDMSPVHLKKYVITKSIRGSFLLRLALHDNNDIIIKLIIQSATAKERKEMFLSENGVRYLDTLVNKGRWDRLVMSIEESITPENRKVWIGELIDVYNACPHMVHLPRVDKANRKQLLGLLQDLKNNPSTSYSYVIS